MSKYFIAFILGFAFFVLLAYMYPTSIRAVNEELVRQDMAYYNKTGTIVWRTNK